MNEVSNSNEDTMMTANKERISGTVINITKETICGYEPLHQSIGKLKLRVEQRAKKK
jgi:hypothetical protein